MARLFRDHYTKPVFVWLRREKGPILVWASTYLYGYDVLDLGAGTLQHVVEREGEDFIWTGVSLAPNQQLLAIDGCYWACPYSIRILHVGERLLSLPFREITLFQRQDGELQWTSDRTR